MRPLPLIALLALTACAPGLSVPDSMTIPAGHRGDVAGIPYVAAGFSSGIQVSPDYLLTVQHSNWPDTQAVSKRYDARLVKTSGRHSPVGARPQVGQEVILFGTGPHGQPRYATGIVVHERAFTCAGKYDPAIHITVGYCTRKGQGYIYGFGVRADGVRGGFSGGGVYDSDNRVIGMVRSVGGNLGQANEYGTGIVFAQHIGDLIEEFDLTAERAE